MKQTRSERRAFAWVVAMCSGICGGVMAVASVAIVPTIANASVQVRDAKTENMWGIGSASDSLAYLRAESLVNNGDAKEGRALVDSLVAATKVGTPAYAEGLYWRAKLSASADSAQRDYLRVIVDYSSSPRVPDALLNLGQLEFVRGDRDKALRHFERLRRNYPGHSLQPVASYWVARTLLESNELQKGCAVNAEALAQVKPADVELKNRIDYQNLRCRGVELAAADSEGVAEQNVASNDTNNDEAAPSETTAKPTSPAATPSKTIPVKGATASESGGKFSVQVAAFKTKAQANTLVASLKQKGYTARVDGTTAPYRVRIGRFVSRAGAEALLAELKARNIDGFITKG